MKKFALLAIMTMFFAGITFAAVPAAIAKGAKQNSAQVKKPASKKSVKSEKSEGSKEKAKPSKNKAGADKGKGKTGKVAPKK